MWMKQRNQWPLLASVLCFKEYSSGVEPWEDLLNLHMPRCVQTHGNHPTLGGERYIGGLGRHRKALCNCQEPWRSKVFPSLQADRLGYHSFRDAGRRVETPESEAKGSIFLMVIAAARESPFCTKLQCPVPTACLEEGRWHLPTVGLLKEKNPEIREPGLCIMCSQHAWRLLERGGGERKRFSLLYWTK